MKILVLFLGSTTLVAGGTAITSQQDVRNNMTTQRSHQEHLQGSQGACCFQDTATCVDDLNSMECLDQGGAWRGWATCSETLCLHECENAGIFSNIAKPIALNCGPFNFFEFDQNGHYLDLDGDGVTEKMMGQSYTNYYMGQGFSNITALLEIDSPASFSMLTLLDVSPDALTYEDNPDFTGDYSSRCIGYIDVTGDDLPDALIGVMIGQGPLSYYYVENISTPKVIACVSDLNNDGAVEVNDLMQIISDWGPCE
jgi:hypothetical protein